MILVVPPGADGAPISHGTAQYQPYRANHTDPSSRWLVEVPPEVARYLIQNAGFYLCPEQQSFSPRPLVPARPRDGEPRAVSWNGFSFPPDERGVNWLPVEAINEMSRTA